MAVPIWQAFLRPVLVYLKDGEVRRSKDVRDAMAVELAVSDSERAETIPSGPRRFDNRVEWAFTHLSQAGLIERPQRAHLCITEAGRQLLASGRQIDMRTLLTYPSYQEFRSRKREAAQETDAAQVGESAEDDASPQDLAAQAEGENRSAVEAEVLTRALDLTPTEFERLVIKLLRAMGYGQLGRIEHSGRTGDGGIDGIISQDPLGLDRIYVQAKRYSPEVAVGRPALQGFVGALMGAQGDRGVFITTSGFTSGAIDEANRVNARIELIDGRRLAKLMVANEVGVQPEARFTLYKLDEDFFEDL